MFSKKGLLILLIILLVFLLFGCTENGLLNSDESSALGFIEEYYSVINSSGLEDAVNKSDLLISLSTGQAKDYFLTEKDNYKSYLNTINSLKNDFISDCQSIGSEKDCLEKKEFFDNFINDLDANFVGEYFLVDKRILDINSTNAVVEVNRKFGLNGNWGEITPIKYYLAKDKGVWKLQNYIIGETPISERIIDLSNERESVNLALVESQEEMIYSICAPDECALKNYSECDGVSKINYVFSCGNSECISKINIDNNSFDCNYWVPCNNCESKSNTKCDGTTLVEEIFYCDQKEGCKSEISKEEQNENCGYRDPSKYYYISFNKVLTQTDKYFGDSKLKVELVKVGQKFNGDNKDLRVYWKIENTSNETVSVYPHSDTIIISNQKQYESSYWDTKLFNDEISLGNSSGGIMQPGVVMEGGVSINKIPLDIIQADLILEVLWFNNFKFSINLDSGDISAKANNSGSYSGSSYSNSGTSSTANTSTTTTNTSTYCGLYEIEQNGQCVDCGGENEIVCRNNTCQYGFEKSGDICIESCGFLEIRKNGSCVSCGQSDESCCTDDYCYYGSCVDGTCRSCGNAFQNCCEGNVCTQSGYTCYGGKCMECGYQNRACCSNNYCNGSFLTCVNGTCEGCGYKGEPCCDGVCAYAGLSCNSGICG